MHAYILVMIRIIAIIIMRYTLKNCIQLCCVLNSVYVSDMYINHQRCIIHIILVHLGGCYSLPYEKIPP